MLSEKVKAALLDILNNINSIADFTAGMTLNEFEDSQMHFYAVIRGLEIISEASRRLPDETRANNLDLPWQQIMSAGNAYRHEYGSISPARVWMTVQNSLPALRAFVEQQLQGET